MPDLLPKMFISYSRVDRDTTARLVQRLRRSYRHENVWFDEELHGGLKWWDEILRRISECDIFIYLLSNESVTSPYCQAEFTEARRLQKPIITVQIRNTTKLSDELKLIQYVDMRDGINDETLADLVRSVNEQAQLAKKRRALWTPATPMPEIPKTETIASTQPDTNTPTLESVRPAGSRPAPRGDVLVAGATIIAALIGAAALIISTLLPPNQGLATATSQDSTDGSSIPIAALAASTLPSAEVTDLTLGISATLLESTAVPTDTSVPQPTDTYTPTATDTPQPSDTPILTFTPTETPTFTPTNTYTNTPSATSTPSQTPTPTDPDLEAAYSFAGSQNSDWTPTMRTFNGVEMVLVPVGCFEMGNNGDGGHQCFEEPFWIDRYEVTNEQYGSSGAFSGSDLPRETVNWFDATAHCESRDAHLPTEREWEYAARGVSNWIYPWGNEFVSSNARYGLGISTEATARVGTHPGGVSWVGAYDMTGNVWEWTSSVYQNYPYNPTDGREDSANGSDRRVLRGGSWNFYDSGYLRAADRLNNSWVTRSSRIGFRCALSS